jgi:RNA polymerase sigma factor (sigma-70 family)
MTHPVYLVDDDAAVRKALSLLLKTLGMHIVAFAGPEALLGRLQSLAPGCLVLDIRMPVISGLRLQERLTDAGCDWPVIVISGHGDIEACRRAFRNGAVDFLSKPVDEQDLIDAIQKAHALLTAQRQRAAERAEAAALLARLTAREREVLDRVAEGFTTREIAVSLGVSPRTVESHRAQIAAKLHTTSPAEMTRLLIDGGTAP